MMNIAPIRPITLEDGEGIAPGFVGGCSRTTYPWRAIGFRFAFLDGKPELTLELFWWAITIGWFLEAKQVSE